MNKEQVKLMRQIASQAEEAFVSAEISSERSKRTEKRLDDFLRTLKVDEIKTRLELEV